MSGVSYGAANRRLTAAHSKITVDWTEAVSNNRSWITDSVHPITTGCLARAHAVLACII